MPFCGDPRDLDTYNDFDDEPERGASAADVGDTETTYGPMREPCPECGEPAVAAWDHQEACPYHEETIELPF